jgi:hypothetical protein
MTAICPTDVVEAPISAVWALLMNPAGWGGFYDVRVVSVDPPGPAHVGQVVRAESGPPMLHLAVTFRFTDIEPGHGKLGMDVRLPLGVTVREDMTVSPVDAERCGVSYSGDFGFPRGLRGALVRALIGKEMTDGPAESLARLKAAAERAPQLS